jgi:hypothetical protein
MDFDFVTNLELIDDERNQQALKLIAAFRNDISNNLVAELDQFHAYVKARNKKSTADNGNAGTHIGNGRPTVMTHQQLYSIIVEEGIQAAFPTIEVILRLFLSLMVTNCSGERSFSHLKRIKNELRSTMTQERLTSLSLLCIERDKLREMTFDDGIDDFALQKSCKRIFL